MFYSVVADVVRSTELDSVNDDVLENDDDIDSDEDSGVLKNYNSGQGTISSILLVYSYYCYNVLCLILVK